jgi:exoribonuclease-2
MARALQDAKVSSIRRVVKTPERWPRIVELAAQHGGTLPAEPDSGALNAFLQKRKAADPDHYADVSLAVVKLMGPGEYVLSRSGEEAPGHFALAAHDYTHSTAPNRRFADTVTQRLIKSVLVERVMGKRIAAVAMQHRIGDTFSAVVTGAGPKGVFVRVLGPPVEGMLVRGQQGADVGDRLQVKLVGADPRRGFIDFART